MRAITILICAAVGSACNAVPETAAPEQGRDTALFVEVDLPRDGSSAWPDGTGLSPEIMGPGVALVDSDADGVGVGRGVGNRT
jgi:hypothetical protein